MEKSRGCMSSKDTIGEAYIPDLVSGTWFRFCFCKMSQRRMLLVFHAEIAKRKKTFTQREGEKLKGCQGAAKFVSRPISLATAFYRHITSLPLKKRKVYDKQHSSWSMRNGSDLAISADYIFSSLPLYLSLHLDPHLHFPFQMPMRPFQATHANSHKVEEI